MLPVFAVWSTVNLSVFQTSFYKLFILAMIACILQKLTIFCTFFSCDFAGRSTECMLVMALVIKSCVYTGETQATTEFPY